jgi:hypothetical protein
LIHHPAERPREAVHAGVTGFLGDGLEAQIAAADQIGRGDDAHAQEKLLRSLTKGFTEALVEMALGQVALFRQSFDRPGA